MGFGSPVRTEISDAPPDVNGVEAFCASAEFKARCEAGQVRLLPADVDGYRARVRRPAAVLVGLQRGYAAVHVATLALVAATRRRR